jgi:hypothetical protein
MKNILNYFLFLSVIILPSVNAQIVKSNDKIRLADANAIIFKKDFVAKKKYGNEKDFCQIDKHNEIVIEKVYLILPGKINGELIEDDNGVMRGSLSSIKVESDITITCNSDKVHGNFDQHDIFLRHIPGLQYLQQDVAPWIYQKMKGSGIFVGTLQAINLAKYDTLCTFTLSEKSKNSIFEFLCPPKVDTMNLDQMKNKRVKVAYDQIQYSHPLFLPKGHTGKQAKSIKIIK